MSHNIHYATRLLDSIINIRLSASFRVENCQKIVFLCLEWGGFRGKIGFFQFP